MNTHQGVSRRGFVTGAAGAAVLPAALGGIGTVTAAAPPEISIAATVVRVSHSKVEPHALRVGVRTSIQAPELDLDNIVLVVDGIPFMAEPARIRALIAEGVKEQVGRLLAGRDIAASADRAAVQVFGVLA